MDPSVSRSLEAIVAACGELSTSAKSPFYHLIDALTAENLTMACQFLEASHTVDILRDAGPGGLHVAEIASKIDYVRSENGAISQPTDKTWISHLLRLLAVHRIGNEISPDVFANNRISSLIDSGKSLDEIRNAPEKKCDGTNGFSAFVGMITHEPYTSMGALTEWMLSPKGDIKYATPFNYAFETGDPFYAWVERPENASRLAQISRAMVAAGGMAEGGASITDTASFPWDALPPSSLVIDVGGGIGGVSARIAAAHTHLRCVVQDRPQVADMAAKVWAERPDVQKMIEEGRMVFQAADFFAPQPGTYPGAEEGQKASVFVLTRVLHNWTDEACVNILKHLRSAATSSTRLLISEQIMPYACPDSEPPSNPSTGTGSSSSSKELALAYSTSYKTDLTMLSTFSGRERTLPEFTTLARAGGWEITQVARSPASLWAYTTAVPA